MLEPQKPYSEKINMVQLQTPIIWNITNKCPYSCSFCCVNANGSQEDLSLEDKLRIIKNLDSSNIRLDISGGEPLIDNENLVVIRELARKFGKEKVSITSTGKGLERVNLRDLARYISEVGFTYDFPREPSPDRPLGYNAHNLELAGRASDEGIETMAQITLTRSNISPSIIGEIYLNLHKEDMPQLLLMRFSESGRGLGHKDVSINQHEINEALETYKELERKYETPRIKIVPSVRIGFLGKVLASLNITNKGLLLSNSWAYLPSGEPEEYAVLGNLVRDSLSELVGRNIYQRFFTQLRINMKK